MTAVRRPHWPGWTPTRRDRPEWMDQPGHSPALLRGALDDLRRINRWLGGVWLTRQALAHLTGDLGHGASLSLLDVAAGGADIPAAVAAWARRRHLRLTVVVTDLSPAILRAGRQARGVAWPCAVADARRLPFASNSVDVVMCSLVLHHLAPADAVAMLGEMRRVARCGIIVNDLVRTWVGYGGALIVGRLLTANPLTRHDAPVSVRRAYTRAEMVGLAARAGLGSVTVQGCLGYRVVMTARSAA